jgi:pimeloyl-ACP methyl ester carboxylesterase
VSVAYQVVGSGPIDLVLVHGWVCSFQPGWEWPALARFYRRLSGLGRLILFDKRGTGLSDRVPSIPTLEQRMDDLRAVMDAAGSDRATVLGISEGGPMCALFAATYPERTAAFVGMGTYARRMWAPDYPIGFRRTGVRPPPVSSLRSEHRPSQSTRRPCGGTRPT